MNRRLPEEFVLHLSIPLRAAHEEELARALAVRKGLIRIDVDRAETSTRISIVHTGEDAGIHQVVEALCLRYEHAEQKA